MQVFARGQDGALWTQEFDGGWRGWYSLGGVVTSPSAPVSTAPGTTIVFTRGQDAALWMNYDVGSGFVGWYGLGGTIK